MKLSGKGPANTHINVFIYSGQPIIIAVKTDSNGDWTYAADKEIENGDHEVYVAVTNNSGAIKAKSSPLPFIKTAEAITVTRASGVNLVQSDTTLETDFRKIAIIITLSISALGFAFLLIGLVFKRDVEK